MTLPAPRLRFLSSAAFWSMLAFAANTLAAEPKGLPEKPIRLERSRPEIDAHLAQAYGHLQAGRLEAARHDYETTLRANPRNVDALLGLSAITRRQGRPGEAQQLARRAADADPLDAHAQAAVLAIAANLNPAAAESRLKTLLADQAAPGPLSFCLGNLYASQERWAEAQQAYFNATAADGDNPDYLFNLAISLDHLRQQEPAARHYRLALEAATRRPAAFDPLGAQIRLLALQP